MWRKGNPHTLLVEMSICAASMGNRMKPPKKIRHKITLRPSNLSSGYLPENFENAYS